jgi:TetR/AcrR family transcriptional repressor of nem operon
MARPRQFKEADVKAALRDVFWEHGFDGASYAQIMAATGLQKGSLYASFGDKRALYQHALSDYDANHVSPGVKMLRDTSRPGEERISDLFDSVVGAAGTRQGRWGCLLCNAAVDQAPFDSDVEKTVTASMERMRAAIAECVSDTPAFDKAELIWTAYFGGRVMVKAGYGTNILETQRQQVMELFD